MGQIDREPAARISISVVSHTQIALVADLLRDIEAQCHDSLLEFILTLNLDETLPFGLDDFSFPIKIIRNAAPKGFGANHNQAFTYAAGRYFCVMNPDIRLASDPFQPLLACLKDQSAGVVAPLVLGKDGRVEDSARRFPSPFKIVCKAFGGCKGSDYPLNEGGLPIHPDWAGGMFLLFPRVVFERLGGFDQRFFLYYEDVDLCGRLRLLDYEVVVCPKAPVSHYAQRSSHRNLKYLRWHLRSMIRFFLSPVYWRLKFRNLWKTKLVRR